MYIFAYVCVGDCYSLLASSDIIYESSSSLSSLSAAANANNNDRISPKRRVKCVYFYVQCIYTHSHTRISNTYVCSAAAVCVRVFIIIMPEQHRIFNNAKTFQTWPAEIAAILTFLWFLPVSVVVVSHCHSLAHIYTIIHTTYVSHCVFWCVACLFYLLTPRRTADDSLC